MHDPITEAVAVLNDVLERDPEAITHLINMRIDCNHSLASHSSVKVQKFGDIYRIGVLGLLNGALGGSPNGDIGAKGIINSNTGMFKQIKVFVDLRKGRLDILA